MKIDLPSYDGKRKIQILSGLVKEYQELLQLYEYTRKKEGLLSSTKAKGWRASMIGTSRGEGEEMVKDILLSKEKMEKLMTTRFLPLNYEQTLHNQYVVNREAVLWQIILKSSIVWEPVQIWWRMSSILLPVLLVDYRLTSRRRLSSIHF